MTDQELKRPFYIDHQEVKRMVDYALSEGKTTSLRNKLIIELIYKCGLRSNELVNMKIEDIKPNGKVDVEVAKGGKKREVLIDPELLNWINVFIKQEGRRKGYLIRSTRKRKMTNRNVRHLVKRIGREALGKDVHPHTLRHSFAVNFLNKTNNLRKLQQLLGHKSIHTTQRYLQYNLEDIREDYVDAFKW